MPNRILPATTPPGAFNNGLFELRRLARRVHNELAAKTRLREPFTITVDFVVDTHIERLARNAAGIIPGLRWPHDRAADLICAWQLERAA